MFCWSNDVNDGIFIIVNRIFGFMDKNIKKLPPEMTTLE